MLGKFTVRGEAHTLMSLNAEVPCPDSATVGEVHAGMFPSTTEDIGIFELQLLAVVGICRPSAIISFIARV